MSWIKGLIFWLFWRQKDSMDKKHPVLIFDLGNMQVFHFQTDAEKEAKAPPLRVYWQDKITRRAYGPFNTVTEAMQHYTWTISTENTANIIYIDFKSRKRIQHGK